MTRNRRRILFGMFLLGFAGGAYAQDACQKTTTLPGMEFAIRIEGGRRSFVEGDAIPLRLEFHSTVAKQYTLEGRMYERFGRLDIEAFCLDPPARDPLANYGPFFAGEGGLSADVDPAVYPFEWRINLNEWRRPKPGHYRLYLVSFRTQRTRSRDAPPMKPEEFGYVRSNTIEFDVTALDSRAQAEELSAVVERIKQSKPGALQRLRYLDTREAARELARLYEGNSSSYDVYMGLFESAHEDDVIAALRAELKSPSHPISEEFILTLSQLEAFADPKYAVPAYGSVPGKDYAAASHRRQARVGELQAEHLRALKAASLWKVGRARAITARTLLTASGETEPSKTETYRKDLLAHWDRLSKFEQEELIRNHWPEVRDGVGQDVLPYLRKLAATPRQPNEISNLNDTHDLAIRRIFELSPDEARSTILSETKAGDSRPPPEAVALLRPADLHEVWSAAAQRMAKGPFLDGSDLLMVARFGDASVLDGVRTAYGRSLPYLTCSQHASFVHYFLRAAPPFGVSELRAALASPSNKVVACPQGFLKEVGTDAPAAYQVAVEELNQADRNRTQAALAVLGKWGTPEAEQALLARLEKTQHPADAANKPAEAALADGIIATLTFGSGWLYTREKLEKLVPYANSEYQKKQLASWIQMWDLRSLTLMAGFGLPGGTTFSINQYMSLNETQLVALLSKLPAGTKVGLHLWKPGQIYPAYPLPAQEEIWKRVHDAVAPSGVEVEKRFSP